MIIIIGVKFRKSGKVYYFDPVGLPIERGNHVIVETARGIEYGKVVLPPREVTDDQVVQPLKPVIRLATEDDDRTAEENIKSEKEAYKICLEKIRNHQLQMKLIDSEYTFDRNKLLFYFTADGRIDFRELVKDLASVFHTRIELRQIGVRDETKLIGGIAICGRPLCCHSYLTEFAPVSIKMAKEQNLSLNPSKISGVCGRLMCCLKNEQEAYEDLNRSLPHIGAEVTTADGNQGVVQSVSVLRQLVKVIIENESGVREVKEYHVSKLNFHTKKNSHAPIAPVLPDESLDESELRELENLEKEDLDETADIAYEEEKKTQNKKRPRNTNRSRSHDHSYQPDRNGRRDRESRDRKPYHEKDHKREGRERKERHDSHYHKESSDSNRTNRNKEYSANRDNRRRNRNNRRSRRNNAGGVNGDNE